MKESTQTKYLISSEQDPFWGLVINSVGYQRIDEGVPYPPINHPEKYLFSPQCGRVLHEYQLVYISHGKGTFVSASHKTIELSAGNMFLLFPGEWHSYFPDKNCGWSDYWIGFEGVNIDSRVEHKFFDKENPVFKVGVDDEIVQLYKRAIDIGKNQTIGYQQLLAGIVNFLLGIAYSRNKYSGLEDTSIINQINSAKIYITENYQNNIKTEQIAQEINISYSWFRKIFKQYTGLSAQQYIQEIRLQKSKELLFETFLSTSEIAYKVGFNSPDYFSAVFKKRIGISPTDYRRANKLVDRSEK